MVVINKGRRRQQLTAKNIANISDLQCPVYPNIFILYSQLEITLSASHYFNRLSTILLMYIHFQNIPLSQEVGENY
jgi:hypothetical protein